jgi:uncharacterized surface protein with fasciclin (FAS1) repeats
MRRSFWKILGFTSCTLIALAGVGSATAQDKPADKPKHEEKKPEAKKPEAKKEEKKGEKNIVETAMADKNFSTLCELLTESGLAETLKGDGPYTVFAPTNAAFEKLGKEALDGLKKDKAKLSSVLKYHVHSGKLMAADVSKAKTITTLNGAELTVTVKDKDVMVDKSKVTMTDTKCKNGLIHAIDTVAMPSEKKPDKPKG